MQDTDFERRRKSGFGERLFAGRTTVQIVVGAIAIAVIALAFIFRPVEAPTKLQPAAAASKPTSAPVAAVVPIATPTVAPTSTPEQSAAAGEVYVVESGDTLSTIAKKYYDDASKFDKIFEANKDILESPDSLQIGQKLKIPK